VDRADGLRLACRQCAGSWRTVRPTQRAPLTVVDFAFLPLEFKCKQSVRASQTVRKVRVFHIMASNGKGEYKYSMPGWESLSWHFERFILPCRTLPLLSLSLTWLSGCIFVRMRASSALHQGFDLCGTRELSSKWLICYSWKLLLPRRLGGGRIR
jgi:hypothetical protein